MSFFCEPPEGPHWMKRAVSQVSKPLSRMYRSITAIRNHLYDSGSLPVYHARIPIVCVGNLTVGGTGKTPLVLALASSFVARGERPVILSRGYGGRYRGPYVVKSSDEAKDVGDEPLLLARRGICTVVISRDRVAGARFIEGAQRGSVIILDDGFQHRRLGRSCNIVSFFVGTERAVEEIERGELLPRGRFREDRDSGLHRADMVVLSTRGGRLTDSMRARIHAVMPQHIPILELSTVALPPSRSDTVLEKGPVWLFCAIANPEGFLQSLESLGYTIAGTSFFSDHHSWSSSELAKLKEQAKGLPLVCTEKDAIKLPDSMRREVWVVSISVVPPKELVDGIFRTCGL